MRPSVRRDARGGAIDRLEQPAELDALDRLRIPAEPPAGVRELALGAENVALPPPAPGRGEVEQAPDALPLAAVGDRRRPPERERGLGVLPAQEPVLALEERAPKALLARRPGAHGSPGRNANAASDASTSCFPIPRAMKTRRERRSSSGQASRCSGGWTTC